MLAIRFIGFIPRYTDALLHSGACMILPGIMRAGQWEGSFKFNASLLSIYPVIKVCNVLSNKFLSFCSSEQPRGMETFCVVFGFLGPFDHQVLRKHFIPGIRFLVFEFLLA